MFRIKFKKKIVIIATGLSFILSYLLHHPKIEGNIYSDIVSFWYRPLVRNVKIPYIQEGFEYPPMAGLITYISSLIGGGELIPYYNIFSIILLLSYMLLVLTVQSSKYGWSRDGWSILNGLLQQLLGLKT